MSLPTKEFLESYATLCDMPEAENPNLKRRLLRLVERMHEQRAEWQRTGNMPAIGDDITPENCPECTPEEPCFGHGLMTLVKEFDEYRKTKKL